jgi:hypothetical protein
MTCMNHDASETEVCFFPDLRLSVSVSASAHEEVPLFFSISLIDQGPAQKILDHRHRTMWGRFRNSTYEALCFLLSTDLLSPLDLHLGLDLGF